ncbi:MAG: copper resistance protein CopC/CopD [Actinobacteria bacterium]|nr:copper resistance protein CopC/CopD [Actinomycetota bacterium]
MRNSTRSSTRPAVRWALALLCAGLAAASWAEPASAADNTLVSSTPAANSSIDTFAGPITLVFAAPVGPSPQVTMTCGDPGVQQSLAEPILLADQVTVSVEMLTPAPAGTCTVGWRVTDTSLQPAGSNSFAFAVINETAVTVVTTTTTIAGTTAESAPSTTVAAVPITTQTPSTTESNGGSSGPLGLFRLLSNLGLAMLFGALVVIAIAWPEGVEYILTVRHLRTAWGLAVAGSYLYAAALAADQSGGSLGGSLIPTGWGDLLDTTSGKAALLRMVFVLASIYVVMRPERTIDPATQLAALVPPGLAVVTLAFSREEFGLIEYAAGAVHAVAMAVWIGGLILLTRVVLAGPGEEDLVHAVRGFARISTPALWATVASGAVLLFRLDRGQLGSSHGLVLIVKTLLVSIMVFVGVAARQFISQRVARVDAMTAPLATRLRRALGIEALVGIVVLGLTSWLLALTPPGLNASGDSTLDLGAPKEFVNNAMNVDVVLAFSERVGTNDVRIEVVAPPTGLVGLTVNFLPPAGATVPGMTIDPIPLTGPGVAVLEKSDGFTLSASGTWTVQVLVGGVLVSEQQVFVGGDAPVTTESTTA